MQGNFSQWSWKVCCAVMAVGLISAGAEAGTRRVSSKYCPPEKETWVPPSKCEPAPPVCEPQPKYEPKYETYCEPKQPTCDYNVDCLRSTLCEIAKEVQCFQVKARCVKRPDVRVLRAVINFVTALVLCQRLIFG